MRIAVYMRVSTDPQIDSIDNQYAGLVARAQLQGAEIVKEYKDLGISGTDIRKRKDLQELLYDAGIDIEYYQKKTLLENGNYSSYVRDKQAIFIDSNRPSLFDEIWVKNTSRLFRRSVMSSQVLDILKKRKIVIRFLEQGFSTEDITYDLLIKIMSLFDEEESHTKSSRVKWGYEQTLKKNKIHNKSLYGFDYDAINNTLTPNKDAAAIKRIFELYAIEKLGYHRISKVMEEEGFKTATGSSVFGKTTINRILNNPKYAGFNNIEKRWDSGEVFNKKSSTLIRDVKIEKNERIIPIISEDLYNKAREETKKRQKKFSNEGTYKGITELSILGFNIRCGNCFGSYISNWEYNRKTRERTYQFYNCTNKRKRKNLCHNPNVKAEKIYEYLENLRLNYSSYIRGELAHEKIQYLNLLDDYLYELDNRDIDKELLEINNKISANNKRYTSLLFEKQEAESYNKKLLLNDLMIEAEDLARELKDEKLSILNYQSETLKTIKGILENLKNLEKFNYKKEYNLEDLADRIHYIIIQEDGSITHIDKSINIIENVNLPTESLFEFHQWHIDDLYKKLKKYDLHYSPITCNLDDLFEYKERNGKI